MPWWEFLADMEDGYDIDVVNCTATDSCFDGAGRANFGSDEADPCSQFIQVHVSRSIKSSLGSERACGHYLRFYRRVGIPPVCGNVLFSVKKVTLEAINAT